jgi:murein DD-endopeptidase MepM/ murein hydrolase activator NlpD
MTKLRLLTRRKIMAVAVAVFQLLGVIGCDRSPVEWTGSESHEKARSNTTAAIVRTPTGYAYPVDWTLTTDGNFGACGAAAYYAGLRHTGTDIAAAVGTTVRSVGSGRVVQVIGPDLGAGPGNYAVLIQTGGQTSYQTVIATMVYGHIRNLTVRAGDNVNLGTVLGTVGPYSGGNHLHFGVHPGPSLTFVSRGWGRLATSCSGTDYNGFTEPIRYIRTVRPL